MAAHRTLRWIYLASPNGSGFCEHAELVSPAECIYRECLRSDLVVPRRSLGISAHHGVAHRSSHGAQRARADDAVASLFARRVGDICAGNLVGDSCLAKR